jgi:hypothetical protein
MPTPDDLLPGLVPGAIIALASIAMHEGILTALAVAIGCFIVVNGLIILYCEVVRRANS